MNYNKICVFPLTNDQKKLSILKIYIYLLLSKKKKLIVFLQLHIQSVYI